MSDQNTNVIGNTVVVGFTAFNKTATGKVDTGATTSSLHATNIQVDERGRQVSFQCDILSPNVVKLPLEGTQEVHSADAGGNSRPMVTLDVTINGKHIERAVFNLNDRGNMDTKILVGQNILQAANVVIDPKQDNRGQPDPQDAVTPVRNEAAVLEAIEVLAENNVSLSDLVKYLHTAAINRIKD